VDRLAGDIVTEARTAGLEVRAEAERLVVRGPRAQEAFARGLLAAKGAVLALLAAEDAEVAWRVDAMRSQVPRNGPIPFLVAREGGFAIGCCRSCGDPIEPDRRFRCRLCVQAAQLVLQALREGVAE
jgi:hypothetical protein